MKPRVGAARRPLCERLREAREERGLDRKDAAHELGMADRYLEMLEEGRYPLVADPAYLAPFARKYATFLGLPAELAVVDLLAEVEIKAAHAPANPTAARFVRRRIDIEITRRIVGALRPAAPFLAATAALALGLFVGRGALIETHASRRPASLAAPVVVARVEPALVEPPRPGAPAAPVFAQPVRSLPVAATAAGTSLPVPMIAPAPSRPDLVVPVPPAGAALVAAPATGHELTLTATERQVWLWVSIDGGPKRETELLRGRSASWRASEGYVLTVDDAGGVIAKLNGQTLPPLGASGRARKNIVLPVPASTELGSLPEEGAALARRF